jgi:hypothetical protein
MGAFVHTRKDYLLTEFAAAVATVMIKNTQLTAALYLNIKPWLECFFCKRGEVTGGWRKWDNMYSLLNIMKMIKWRRMRCAGHTVLYAWQKWEMHVKY